MDFAEYRSSHFIEPLELPAKEDYLRDLYNIEHSLTGRVDAWIANTFITEASYLIVNSISLFEKGYFDCAYYSLRQSIETATTMMYLTEIDATRKAELGKWKSEKNFPMYNQMIQYLDNNESVFKDIKDNLNDFFEELSKTKRKLNKYAHKQGFDKFYSSRKFSMSRAMSQDKFITEYENCLTSSIGAVAVMRLAIDPMPVLLSDEEIYSRTGDEITSPYAGDFMDKYIGGKTIAKYKQTQLYGLHYDYFMQNEKQNDVVSYVIKDQFVDTDRIDEILSQGHLLSRKELYAVKCCKSIERITKFYTTGGMMMYMTNRPTDRIKTEWSSKDFDSFSGRVHRENIPYDEAYITVINLDDEIVYFEHNGKLSDSELSKLKHIT